MILKTKSKTFHLNKKTLIMGILNTTPDSFSDGGQFDSVTQAVAHAQEMVEAGADIIDIGGESTRPDHRPVSETEEIERVVPIIQAVSEAVEVPISIDTYKARTAEAAIQAGAEIINDIWGAKKDPEMASIAAKYQIPIILMHNRDNKAYTNLIDDMVVDLQASIEIVKAAGVADEQIILDPGIGFAKTLPENYDVLYHIETLMEKLPYPFLLGTSRKSFITEVLDIPADQRDNATGATTCFGVERGMHIIRVHDVKRHVELARMTEHILKRGDQNR